jgi:hypothetical protein
VGLRRSRRISIATAALGIWVCSSGLTSALADTVNLPPRRSISELTPAATIHVGKTADWVAVTADAVWVGSTGPYAVHRIDPKTNRLTASVALPGEPCAGLATGFGSLWVPMCTAVPSLAIPGTLQSSVPLTPSSSPASRKSLDWDLGSNQHHNSTRAGHR